MPNTETPPAERGQETTEKGGEEPSPKQEKGIEAALGKAREALGSGKGLADLLGDDDADDLEAEADDLEEDDADDDLEEEEESDDDDLEEDDADEEDDEEDDEEEEIEDDDLEEEEDEEEEEESEDDEEEGKRFTAKLPGRGPDDPDIEIEVDDQATADRINHMRNGFMRGEELRAATAEIQAAQDTLLQIEEQFTTDPAGFMLDNVEAETLPNVALALLVQEGVWEKLSDMVGALLEDPQELRTLQAESKAARLETRDALKKAAEARKAQRENAAALKSAIDLIVPEGWSESKGEALRKDITRDVVEHIERQKLKTLDPKDLIPIIADRLELNGIDPLEARKAIKTGSRNGAKPSTKKRPKRKVRSGKELRRASAKRKKVAAAPGPGKKTAPTSPKKLPAGQSIQDRIKEVRKRGLGTILGNR